MYLLADLLNIILFGLIGYRKNVVRSNLIKSFPQKSPKEIQNLHRAFNAYFCDLIFETLKTLSISPRCLAQMVTFENTELLHDYFRQQKSIILVLGHHGNWELIGAAFAPLPLHKLFVIYHPLKSKTTERLIYHMRTRLGNDLYTMKGALRGMLSNRNQVTATAFIADQTPSPDHAHWTTFLHQDTPVFLGTERIAQKLKYPIIYMSIRRPKRGRYTVTAKLLAHDPQAMAPFAITETHTQWLQKDIEEQPEIWLWSHRRWKHQRRKD